MKESFNDGDKKRQIPKFGEQRWSDYFGCYVTVHLFMTDENWYFTKPHDAKVYKAEVRWSQLREHKDSPPSE